MKIDGTHEAKQSLGDCTSIIKMSSFQNHQTQKVTLFSILITLQPSFGIKVLVTNVVLEYLGCKILDDRFLFIIEFVFWVNVDELLWLVPFYVVQCSWNEVTLTLTLEKQELRYDSKHQQPEIQSGELWTDSNEDNSSWGIKLSLS